MNFIVFDLEATCWLGRPPKGVNEIIEIGAIKVNRYGEVVSEFNKFVKPIVNPVLSGFCKRLTSISQENVNQARTFDRVMNAFKDWVFEDGDEYTLCSWGRFDKQLLINDCVLHKLEHDWLEYHIDTKEQYHRFKKMSKHGGLKATVKKEGFEFDGVPHRAISDAVNLGKIFIKYLEEWQY